MFEIFDDYCWTKQKKVLIHKSHQVSGLGNFAYWNYKSSIAPSPMHYHSNIIEIHCMIKGKRYTQIEKDGKIFKYVTTGNEAFLTFPFEVHSNGTEPQAPCEFYAFQVDISNPNNMLGLDKEYSNALYKHLISVDNRHLSLGSTHINLLRSAFNFFSEQTPDSTRIGTQFLTCFLFSLCFLKPVLQTEIKQIDNRIKNSIDYLNQNIHENMQLEDLAQASGYSLSRFKVKFKKEIGITPAEYIALQKIELAKQKLSGEQVSITELAYDLGFSSSNYFCAVFKKFMSCTPKQYQMRYAKSSLTAFSYPQS